MTDKQKVVIVIRCGDWQVLDKIAVFSTKEKAEASLEDWEKGSDWVKTEEIELDES